MVNFRIYAEYADMRTDAHQKKVVNFRIYAEYADMRTDAHRKKVAHGQP